MTLREEIKKQIGHYYCEDSWFSCPLAEGGTANENVTECNCNLDVRVDQIIDSVLKRLPKPVFKTEREKNDKGFSNNDFMTGHNQAILDMSEAIKGEE